MEYVKKNALGYTATKSEENATHVVLDISEYNELANQLNQLTLKIKEKDEQIKANQQHFINDITKNNLEKGKLKEQIVELSKTNNEINTKLEDKTNHNNLLIKMMKERANADRRLFPKKQHSGYLFLSTITEEYKFKVDGKYHKVKLFKSAFQSPYTIDFDYGFVVSHCIDDFFDLDGKHKALLLDVGISDKQYFNSYEEF